MLKLLRIKKENEILNSLIFEIIKILLSEVDNNQKIVKIKMLFTDAQINK